MAKVLHGKRVPQILVNASFCKRCGICIYFCPTRVFDTREDGLPLVNRREDCIWCGLCEVRCPDFAITLKGEAENEAERQGPVLSQSNGRTGGDGKGDGKQR